MQKIIFKTVLAGFFMIGIFCCKQKSDYLYHGIWKLKGVELKITSDSIIFNNNSKDYLEYRIVSVSEKTFELIPEVEDGEPWIVNVIYDQNDSLIVLDKKFNEEYILVKDLKD